MIIPDPYSVNEVCEKIIKDYGINYDECAVACMSDNVLIGMKNLIEKEIEKRGLNQ